MLKIIICSLKRFVNCMKQDIKRWSKPVTAKLVVGTLTDLKRSRRDLLIENAMLRQQLIVLNRQVKQVQFKQDDRLRLVLLAG